MRGYRINFEIWDFLLYEAMQSKTGRLMRTCKGGAFAPLLPFFFLFSLCLIMLLHQLIDSVNRIQ